MKILISSFAAAALSLTNSAAAFADAPEIPTSEPLTAAEIVALLDGKTYSFEAYDEPLTGTTHWDSKSKTVSGDYVWKKTEKGSYKADWTLDGDKNCTQSTAQPRVCQTVYAYEDGFMEVTAEGKVHSVSKPTP